MNSLILYIRDVNTDLLLSDEFSYVGQVRRLLAIGDAAVRVRLTLNLQQRVLSVVGVGVL